MIRESSLQLPKTSNKWLLKDGNFRADLFDRLNILNLETIPLKFQKDKIRSLIVLRGLENERSAVGRVSPFDISEEAVQLLENYDWHGNFRELLNFATRLAVECLDDPVIERETVQRILGERIIDFVQDAEENHFVTEKSSDNFQFRSDNVITVSFDTKNDNLGSIYLKAAGSVISHILEENDNNFRQAAREMGTTHSTLSRIMKKFKSIDEPQNFQTPPVATQTLPLLLKMY